MTIHNWLFSKSGIKVSFDHYVDGDYIDHLIITMYAYDDYFFQNGPNEVTSVPIKITRNIRDNRIPQNDADLIQILDEMYQDCKDIYFDLKMLHESQRKVSRHE